MKKLIQLIVLIIVSQFAYGQQPTIFTDEYVTQPSTGVFETYYCDGSDKHLWTDSTAGYTSYLWSNGDVTPSITLPTTVFMTNIDTMTLTVGLSSGGTATSTIHLKPTTVTWADLNIIPASISGIAYCPGPMDFSFIGGHSLDSIVIVNTDTFSTPFNSNCNIVNVVMPQPISAFRVMKNGCILPMIEWVSTPFDAQVQPVITQNGSQLTASHIYAQGSSGSNYDFIWYNISGSQVGTGDQYNVTSSGSYYVIFENFNYNGLFELSGQCYGIPGQSCFSVPSDTFNVQLVGIENPDLDNYSIVPNPNEGRFQLKGGNAIAQVEVIDVNGRKVAILNAENGYYDAKALPTGYYWLHWMDENGPQHKAFIKH